MPHSKHSDNSNLPGEVWKPIKGWPYSVSNMGQVKRDGPAPKGKGGAVIGHILRGGKKENGYLHVGLCQNGKAKNFYIHRLVCEAFHGPAPEGKPHAAHLNGQRDDNRACNLKWCSVSENHSHKHAHGTMRTGENHHNTKISKATVRLIRRMHKEGVSQREIGRRTRLQFQTIWNIVHRKTWAYLP